MRCHRQPLVLDGALVEPELRSVRREQGDVAGLGESDGPVRSPDLHIANDGRAKVRDLLGFGLSRDRGVVRLLRRIGVLHHCKARVVLDGGLELRIVAQLGAQATFEDAVHVGEDSLLGTKIGLDVQDVARELLGDRGPRSQIGAKIGTAEAIYGLLRIADQKESAWTQGSIVVPTDKKQNVGLNRISVLELVHQNMSIPIGDRRADRSVAGKERPRSDEDVVEVEDRGVCLIALEAPHEGIGLVEVLTEQSVC